MKVYLKKSLLKDIWGLNTPKNISYFWGFGRFLGTVIIIQILTGLLLAFYYVSGKMGWESVVEITREVRRGWLVRLIHSNTASFVFLILFIHFFRGIIQSSFFLKSAWLRGWIIILLTIISAFLGYVLPWGQISFWGATVIINLIRILPKGKILVIWLWGGFYVSYFTCRFFYALHFLTPLIVIIVSIVHLVLLHRTGRRIPRGLSRFSGLKVKFTHLFSFKDLVNLILLWRLWIIIIIFPDWSADPVNFMFSDLTRSPLHIQPEWYFLHLYAVLRSIPNKIGGLIGFVIALLSLIFLALVQGIRSLRQFKFYSALSWNFFFSNLILIWLGMQPVEPPFINIGQIFTLFYFSYIFIVLFSDFQVILLSL